MSGDSPYFDAAKVDRPQPNQNPGDWVERQCEALGVPISKVARDAGVDRATIWRWRHSETSPYWGTFERVRTVINGYWDRINHETQRRPRRRRSRLPEAG